MTPEEREHENNYIIAPKEVRQLIDGLGIKFTNRNKDLLRIHILHVVQGFRVEAICRLNSIGND